MIDLFQMGEFTLHSGKKSKWKIDCDALTIMEYKTLAWIVGKEWGLKFVFVECIGGAVKKDRVTNTYNFATELRNYGTGDFKDPILIVDDVLTTGASMERRKEECEDMYGDYEVIGVVIFARGMCPDWIHPIFKMDGGGDKNKK